MIKRAAIAAALAVSVSATAGQKLNEEFCAVMAQASHMIMSAHQGGMDMSHALSVVDEAWRESVSAQQYRDTRWAVRDLVIRAYEHPRHASPEGKRYAAAKYRDEMHVQCLRSL